MKIELKETVGNFLLLIKNFIYLISKKCCDTINLIAAYSGFFILPSSQITINRINLMQRQNRNLESFQNLQDVTACLSKGALSITINF